MSKKKLKNRKRISILFILITYPLASCQNIDNPLAFIFSGTKSSIKIKNESISNVRTISIDTVKEIDLKVGEEKYLISTLNYKDGNVSVSNDDIELNADIPDVIRIEGNGKITGIKVGKIMLTAKSKKDGKKVVLLVKVSEIQSTPLPTPVKTETSSPIQTSIPKPTVSVLPSSVLTTSTPKSTSVPTPRPYKSLNPAVIITTPRPISTSTVLPSVISSSPSDEIIESPLPTVSPSDEIIESPSPTVIPSDEIIPTPIKTPVIVEPSPTDPQAKT